MRPLESSKVSSMRAYSLDLRTRVVGAVDEQIGTQKEVASLFGVGCTFSKKLLRQRRESGTLAPKSHGGGPVPKLAGPQREVVRSYIVREQNDATLEEVQAYVASKLGVEVSQATVSRVLQSLDLPRKKNSGGQRAR
jgi:transposase